VNTIADDTAAPEGGYLGPFSTLTNRERQVALLLAEGKTNREIGDELAMIEAWKHYFKRSAGRANGTSAPLDGMLAQILGVDADSVSERDWYVATTIVQWLATNVGQSVLLDAGYREPEPKTRERQETK